ncbi:MAG: glycosyltransferase [Bacteroidia bacterium]|nr:glycosyltransferase [Bacteroidia bacterium]
MDKLAFSFVIPVYKSVATLGPLYQAIDDMMRASSQSFEVIFVEDNGSEESWRKLLELKKQFPANITLIKLTKNFGQNGATLCGIDTAVGNMLVTLDDDLQVHPFEIKKLIAYQQQHQCDVVYGVSKEQTGSVFRNTGSRLIKKIFNKSEGGSNIGSSIRLMNRNIADHLRNHSQDHLFINQVVSWYTFNTGFVEIERSPRPEGKSGYNIFQLFAMAFRLIFLYTSLPLKLMIAICSISSSGSLALAGYYIYRHFVFGQGLGFLVLIVIAISLILASISIMGIYLNRIYSARVRKPHYAIKLKL